MNWKHIYNNFSVSSPHSIPISQSFYLMAEEIKNEVWFQYWFTKFREITNCEYLMIKRVILVYV